MATHTVKPGPAPKVVRRIFPLDGEDTPEVIPQSVLSDLLDLQRIVHRQHIDLAQREIDIYRRIANGAEVEDGKFYFDSMARMVLAKRNGE